MNEIDHTDPVLACLQEAWAALKNLIDLRDQLNVDLTETSRLLEESRKVTRELGPAGSTDRRAH